VSIGTILLIVLVLILLGVQQSQWLGIGATHRFADRASGTDSPLHRPGCTAHNFTVTTCRGQYETVHRRKLEETSYGQHC
jgi:hypothetical protein